MREIRFRGRRVADGKWTYGWLVIEDNGTAWISRYYHRGEWEQVDPATVGQFTGPEDKRGKGIYKGDIWQGMAPDGETQNYIIKWSDFRGHYVGDNPNEIYDIAPSRFNQGEIIGNIHDNPELLP